MLQPAQIREFCERKYPAFLRSLVTGAEFFPLEIPFGRPRPGQDHTQLSNQIKALESSTLGFRIDWAVHKFRLTGEQRIPCRLSFDSAQAYLGAIKKQSEVVQFQHNLQLTSDACPQLVNWIADNPQKLIKHAEAWPGVLEVVCYLMKHPRPEIYAREFPLKVSTKFVEENSTLLDLVLQRALDEKWIAKDEPSFERRYGLKCDEAVIRFRILDATLETRLGIPFMDFSVPISEAEALTWQNMTVVIVENKKTFLSLPILPNAIGIWGGGGAAQLLARFRWLQQCRVFYWGDIDMHGFHIVSRLRGALPHIETVMMNLATLEQFAFLATESRRAVYEDTVMLTYQEHEAYDRVRTRGLLLEQEKLPHPYAVECLQDACVVSAGVGGSHA